MKRNTEEVKADFLEHVFGHRMKVRHDSGIYRHLKFGGGSSVNHFNLTTWPGYLCISGDMGCFTFSRLDDMFEFFRRNNLGINPEYWAEKLTAIDKGGFEEYSPEIFRSAVKDDYESMIDDSDIGDNEARQLCNAINDCVLTYADCGEEKAREAVDEFSYEIGGHEFRFTDFWEGEKPAS